MSNNELKSPNCCEDILALKLLDNFLPRSTYLPYSSSSLSFHSIRLIANDILIHKRHRVLEFGAGISTIILGKFLQTINVQAKLISIDENKEWVDLIQNIIQKENISSVQVIHQDLNMDTTGSDKYWYDQNELKRKITEKTNLIIVDGPSAWQTERTYARKTALDFIIENDLLIQEDFSLYLDDCNRKGEKEILDNWSTKLNSKKSFLSNTLGRLSRNDKFNLS